MSISSTNIISGMTQSAATGSASALTNKIAGPSVGSSSQAGKANGDGFGDLLTGFVKDANQKQATADNAIADFADGRDDNIQNVVVSMAKADLSFRLVMEIRDKLVDSYHEVMRMQV